MNIKKIIISMGILTGIGFSISSVALESEEVYSQHHQCSFDNSDPAPKPLNPYDDGEYEVLSSHQ